jgi:hypothetical protein
MGRQEEVPLVLAAQALEYPRTMGWTDRARGLQLYTLGATGLLIHGLEARDL